MKVYILFPSINCRNGKIWLRKSRRSSFRHSRLGRKESIITHILQYIVLTVIPETIFWSSSLSFAVHYFFPSFIFRWWWSRVLPQCIHLLCYWALVRERGKEPLLHSSATTPYASNTMGPDEWEGKEDLCEDGEEWYWSICEGDERGLSLVGYCHCCIWHGEGGVMDRKTREEILKINYEIKDIPSMGELWFFAFIDPFFS